MRTAGREEPGVPHGNAETEIHPID